MKVRGRGTVLVGEGGLESPPEPFIELDDAEAGALIGRGLAEEYVGDETVVQEPASEPPVATEPVVETVAEPVVETAATEPVVAEPTAVEPGSDDAAAKRLAEIAEHIELLTEDDFVKAGPRAGKPKVKPLADALGWEDLTAEEVDAAFEMKEAAGQ